MWAIYTQCLTRGGDERPRNATWGELFARPDWGRERGDQGSVWQEHLEEAITRLRAALPPLPLPQKLELDRHLPL